MINAPRNRRPRNQQRRRLADPPLEITLLRREWKALRDAAFAISVSPLTPRKAKQLSSQVAAVLGHAVTIDNATRTNAWHDGDPVTIGRSASSWSNLLALFGTPPECANDGQFSAPSTAAANRLLHRAAWEAAATLRRRIERGGERGEGSGLRDEG